MVGNDSFPKAKQSRPKWSFTRRVRDVGIWWGIPLICLQLIGIPMREWGWVLVWSIPGTLFGVLFFAVAEHSFIYLLKRSKSDNCCPK
jgi:hypothetical protein